MKKKYKEKELSSPHLKNLQVSLKEIEKSERYLELERKKLINDKEKIRINIKKEKEILLLKSRIERVKNRKK